MNELDVNVSKVIQAPIEKVFDAWLDPEMLAKMMQPMKEMSDAVVKNDVNVGGKFSIVMIAGDNKLPHEGEYLEISRPNRLVFTWVTSFSSDNSTVTIDFKSLDATSTQIDLMHIKFPSEELRMGHVGAWTGILDALENSILENSI